MLPNWVRGNWAWIPVVLLLAATIAGVWLLKSRGVLLKEGAIVVACPTGKTWGWGPVGNGKCCEAGNTNCVPPQTKSSDGKDYRCPRGTDWGWGANAGKCCKNNANCVAPSLLQATLNKQYEGQSDADLAEQGLVRDPVTKDVVTQREYEKREQERREKDKREGKTRAPTLKEGEDYYGCPPGKRFGWGAGAGKCCDRGTADQNCVPALKKEVGKRCAGLQKPSQCAPGYSVKCQSTSGDTYGWRCCKKYGKRYKCDDINDSKQFKGGTISGSVPTRRNNGQCPPGTTLNGKKCDLYDQDEYNEWFARFYVPRAKDGMCPVGTTGSYKFADGTTDGSKCQVTDENKYKGWKQLNAGKYDAGLYVKPAQVMATWEGCTYYDRQERVDNKKYECGGGMLDTGLNWDKNGSEWGKYQCATSQECRKKIQDWTKGGKYDIPTVTVYEHIGLKGDSKTFTAGTQQSSLRDMGWNDKVSSIKVENTNVTLYEHDNYGGRSITFGPGQYDLTNWNIEDNKDKGSDQCNRDDGGCWNDLVSSLKVA